MNRILATQDNQGVTAVPTSIDNHDRTFISGFVKVRKQWEAGGTEWEACECGRRYHSIEWSVVGFVRLIESVMKAESSAA